MKKEEFVGIAEMFIESCEDDGVKEFSTKIKSPRGNEWKILVTRY
ncbi:MAG: hypothetical protein NTU58_01430 [Candidatus Nealsonbacteria bacterium]|nr:hypothetical protein [Candidatus Nealsonbacteria bacterium]